MADDTKISEEIVEASWREAAQLTPEESSQAMETLARAQPDLLAFVCEMTEESSQNAKELAFYLFFVIYNMFAKSVSEALPRIPGDQILEQLEANEAFLERLAPAHPKFMMRAAETHLASQPHVLAYLAEALVEPEDEADVDDLGEDELGLIFLVLKTVIDLLDHEL